MNEESTVTIEKLYGLPGDETLCLDLAEVWESRIEPFIEDNAGGSRTVEAWSVHAPDYHLPKAEHIVESVVEWAGDNGEVDEWWFESAPKPDDPELVAAAEALRQAIARRIGYRMAKAKVGEHTVTWAPGEESEPLCDGERLYGRVGS